MCVDLNLIVENATQGKNGTMIRCECEKPIKHH